MSRPDNPLVCWQVSNLPWVGVLGASRTIFTTLAEYRICSDLVSGGQSSGIGSLKHVSG
jgi:hypothetical protein